MTGSGRSRPIRKLGSGKSINRQHQNCRSLLDLERTGRKKEKDNASYQKVNKALRVFKTGKTE